jgi:hypothetical protein
MVNRLRRSGTAFETAVAKLSRQRIADQPYGGDLSRVTTSWRYALEAALDREAQARQDFGQRRQKWEREREWSEELRRRRMPPEQRRELERKEHDERMKAISAELNKREKGSAARALIDFRSHVRRGRTAQFQRLLAEIAHTGPDGVTASDISYIVAPSGAHLLAPEQRDKRGREIAEALVASGVLVGRGPDRFVLQEHPAGSGESAAHHCQSIRHKSKAVTCEGEEKDNG